MKILTQLHAKFGDFWWWSLMLFIAARSGDVINAFVGLWLVPKYVPQQELGAVLPLLQVTSVFGLPISILVITFTKFLNEYHTRGETGKVKALIRAFWSWTVVAVVVGTGAALLLLPHFFERIRVQSGSLGILIIITAVTTTVAPMFGNALQGLKMFKAMTIIGVLVAPVRLLVMLVTMPFRALSGYMLGQSAPSVLSIILSCFFLRNQLGCGVNAESIWVRDGFRILKYTGCVTLWIGLGAVSGAVQTMIIRQRLPEIESAAYYIISRFAELAMYAGTTLSVVMFPFAVEASVRGGHAKAMLFKTTIVTALCGMCCAFALFILGRFILSLSPLWNGYSGYVADMALLAIVLTVGIANSNFSMFEVACDRFLFLVFAIPVALLQVVFLAALTGYSFFYGILPDCIVEAMKQLHIGCLRNILLSQLVFAILGGIGNVLVFLYEERKLCQK